MKRKRNKITLKILIPVVILFFIILGYTSYTKASYTSSVIGFITTPLQNLTTKITYSIYNDNDKSSDELIALNKELQKENNELLRHKSEYYELKRENDEYKKMLNLKEQNPDYQFTSASVIGRDPAELYFGMTINEGSLSDISLYDPVITDNGLVGFISAVYPTYSKVTTILSPDANVSVIDQLTLDSGIVNGSMEASETKKAHMKYVSAQNKMSSGDIIVTSGMGGVYPDSLLVGTVDTTIKEENSTDTIITITPFEDVENVRSVFVITDFLGQNIVE